jgi:trimeric autotransporter adhesin
MTRRNMCFGILIAISCLIGATAARAGSFSYQGALTDRGHPATGYYDFQLTAYSSGKSLDSVLAPIVFEQVPVSEGRFQLQFELASADTDALWVELGVRDSGGNAFSRLPERTKAIATPLIGQCWSTSGDSGSNPATNFLGTTDAQALVVRSANQQVTRLEAFVLPGPAGGFTANVLQGSPENFIVAGVRGATISGGGARSGDSEPSPLSGEGPNFVSDHYGTVGGGYNNLAGNGGATLNDNPFATVAGGIGNQAQGPTSTIGGGAGNLAVNTGSTVAGGTGNLADDAGAVGGGQQNRANGAHSVVAGGQLNSATGAKSVVAGGEQGSANGVGAVVSGGFQNCAGGDHSWAGGFNANVRPSVASADGGCVSIAVSGDANGDEGTFAWADAQNAAYTSTGANQFLVRANGGVVMQRTIGSETSARKPRGLFNVVNADSGVAQPAAPNSTVLASFEGSNNGFISVVGPNTTQRGLLFSSTDGDEGGVIYVGSIDSLQFRANGQTHMTLSNTGVLSIAALGAAGATSVCRNANNQLATCSSSARYKEHIEDLRLGLDAAMLLRPVAYQWKQTHEADVGFVAEEVAKLDERLITRNAQGEIEGVKYDRLTTVLAGAVQELAARETLQRQAIDSLTADNAAIRAEMAQLRALIQSASSDAR